MYVYCIYTDICTVQVRWLAFNSNKINVHMNTLVKNIYIYVKHTHTLTHTLKPYSQIHTIHSKPHWLVEKLVVSVVERMSLLNENNSRNMIWIARQKQRKKEQRQKHRQYKHSSVQFNVCVVDKYFLFESADFVGKSKEQYTMQNAFPVLKLKARIQIMSSERV